MKVFLALIYFLRACASLQYRKEGDFIIGAVLPLSTSEQGKCKDKANAEGIAICEGIANAIDRISSDKDFDSLIGTTKIGYDIRDSCGDVTQEKLQFYDMNLEYLAHMKDNSKPKPVSLVVSAFTKASLPSLDLLNIESIPQISYDAQNARLLKDDSIRDDSIKMLVSMYPESTLKVHAIKDIIKNYGFEYVYSVHSNNFQSKESSALLKTELDKIKVCKAAEITLSDMNDVKAAVKTMGANPLIKGVVVICTKEMELELYKEAAAANLNTMIFISSGEWHDDQKSLKAYASVLQGMTFVKLNDQHFNFQTYLEKIAPPYNAWIGKLADTLGGDEAEVSVQLSKQTNPAYHAFNAVFAVANALQKKGADQKLLDAFKDLQFINPLTVEATTFTDHLTTTKSKFVIYNVHGNSEASFSVIKLGNWDIFSKPMMQIQNDKVEFKDGSKVKPESVCSATCAMGSKKSYIESTCCWECDKCPVGQISNITNADQCITCSEHKVANLEQSECVKYKLVTFEWFEGVGAFLIFLMVLSACCVLFALGILSQNSGHDVVSVTGYKMLLFYILGCMLLILAPVPLLMTPTVSSCSAYISVFNLGLTIVFSVFFARSQFLNSHYDEEGKLVKTGCSSFPRQVVIGIVVLIQVLIMVIGLAVDPPLTLHNGTDHWDVRYFECSTWASYVFWVGFGYNLALSIVVNFFSCSSTNMQENCAELKYSLITICVFYLLGLMEIVVFYRFVDAELAGGQAVLCELFALCFFFCFLWPKVYTILFRSKEDGTTVQDTPLLEEDEVHVTTAIHSSAGFKGRGVVQMKIKSESVDEA